MPKKESVFEQGTCHSFPADTSIIFQLSGPSYPEADGVAAKAAADKKYKAFSEIVKKQFPQAKETIIAVNFGTRDFCSFQLTENPFTPNVTKVLLYTLPPDEDKALELLDCGIQAGLTPFCGASRDGEFGAVFFGLKDPESVIDGLYPACNQKLIQEVQKLSRGQELFQIKSATRDFPLERFHEIYYKDIKIILPSEFCSTEKSRIKVTLILRATLQANKE